MQALLLLALTSSAGAPSTQQATSPSLLHLLENLPTRSVESTGEPIRGPLLFVAQHKVWVSTRVRPLFAVANLGDPNAIRPLDDGSIPPISKALEAPELIKLLGGSGERRAFLVVPPQLNRQRYDALVRAISAAGYEPVPVGRNQDGKLVAASEAAETSGTPADPRPVPTPQPGSVQVVDARKSAGEPVAQMKPTIVGSLDKEIIRHVVRSAMPDLRACYDSVAPTAGEPVGTIVLKWLIDGTGSVSTTAVVDDTLGDQRVSVCALRVIASLKFPKPKGGGIVIVNYPFVFKSPPKPVPNPPN